MRKFYRTGCLSRHELSKHATVIMVSTIKWIYNGVRKHLSNYTKAIIRLKNIYFTSLLCQLPTLPSVFSKWIFFISFNRSVVNSRRFDCILNTSINEQTEGTAMRSPVSAVIANLNMKSFEEQVVTSSPYKHGTWKRNVDDTFTFFVCVSVESSLQHLNFKQPFICFTMTTESNKISPSSTL